MTKMRQTSGTGPAAPTPGMLVESGDAARARLAQPAFGEAWSNLYDRCPWAWVGERYELACLWYEMYPHSEPVLVQRWSDETPTRLSGLLPLARTDRGFVLAGGDNAEYRSWLEDRQIGGEFMPQALQALRSQLGPVALEFSWISDDVPLEWARRWTREGTRCDIRTAPTWLLRIGDQAEMETYARKKRRLRSKLNRLKAKGHLEFRHYRTRQELEPMLDSFFALMDFRKGAAYGLLPSRTDHRKSEFLLRLLEETGLLHATGFELDGELIAAHVSVVDRGQVTIQGLAHSAFYSDFSPGQLLILELVKDMSRDGLDTLDFTPGANEYKKRFSDREGQVHRLTIHASRTQGLKMRSVRWLQGTRALTPLRDLLRTWRKKGNAGQEGQHNVEPEEPRGCLLRGENLRTSTGASDWNHNRVLDLVSVDSGDQGRDLAFIRRTSALAERGLTIWTKVTQKRLCATWVVERIEDNSSWAKQGAQGWLLYQLKEGSSGPNALTQLDELLGALSPEVRGQLWALSPDDETSAALEGVGFEVHRGTKAPT